MATDGAKPGRWLGRELRLLRRPECKGEGPSTASQTAWAVMGLLAANDTRSDSVARGIAYLLRTAKEGRLVERGVLHRDRFPEGFLPDVSHVPAILPADCVNNLRQGDEGERLAFATGRLRLRQVISAWPPRVATAKCLHFVTGATGLSG